MNGEIADEPLAMPHIPSNEEIVQLLDELEHKTADDLENEVLEFQLWEPSMRKNVGVALECAVCFANAMGGVIVFGVRNNAKGRRNAITGCSGCDCERLRQHIYESTKPSLNCGVEEIRTPEGTLVVVRVPPAPSRPCGTTGGLFKVRVGKTCQPLDPAGFGEAGEPPMSDEERLLLRTAAEHGGDIHMLQYSETGPFVQVMGKEDLYDITDSVARARFREALKKLAARGLVEHIAREHYSLTGSGHEEARRLGAVDKQSRELIRRQAAALYCRESEGIAVERRRQLEADLADLASRSMSRSSLACTAAVRPVADAIEALAKARIEAELKALEQAGVPLDRPWANALKEEVTSLVGMLGEECAKWLPKVWMMSVGSLGASVLEGIRERARQIGIACHRDIEIALNAELLKAKRLGN